MNKGAKSTSIWASDHKRIAELQEKLSQEWSAKLGTQMSVSQAEVINLALTFYLQRQKFDITSTTSKTPLIKTDDNNVVINHKDTYVFLAAMLKTSGFGPVVFSWTDGFGSQLDVLMVYKPLQFGDLQRGMSSATDLFVAVSGFGMFGFELNGAWKSPGYIAEKLGLNERSATLSELAELINGVCRFLEASR